ncbi:hypothetical protein V2G26_010485 [Clonostachys chloroleuca]
MEKDASLDVSERGQTGSSTLAGLLSPGLGTARKLKASRATVNRENVLTGPDCKVPLRPECALGDSVTARSFRLFLAAFPAGHKLGLFSGRSRWTQPWRSIITRLNSLIHLPESVAA